LNRLLLVGLVALGAGLLLTPLSIVLASRIGVVDRPGELKPQQTPVPMLGGLAVFLAAVVGAGAGNPALIGPLGGALVLGVADDCLQLSPAVRFVCEAAVGVALAAVVHTRVPGVGGYLLIVFGTVLLVNGVNFLDGLDSLAALVVGLSAGGFAVLLHGDGRFLALAVAAGLAGFLVYNRPPARVYLGDGGSYMLGTALAALVCEAWSSHVEISKGVAGLLLVVVPAAEVLFAVVRRVRGRRSVTSGDRRHPYDLLVARGWPVGLVALSYASLQAVLGAAAVATGGQGWTAAAVGALLGGAVLVCVLAAACGALTPAGERT
jgi:UDP-GlcNAc:undecaprenyl-phosphate/decaprenyl-phosphate GlcNAc-1-phosphate transferase